MSPTVETVEIGDQTMATKHPITGNGEVRMVMDTGDNQKVNTPKCCDKKADKHRVEKRGRGKGENRGRCWCAQSVNCFACGVADQDEDEQEQAKSGCSNTPTGSKKKDKTEKQKGQRVCVSLSEPPIITEEERLKGRKKSYRAYLQKFLKMRKDDRMRKKSSIHIQRKMREEKANKEWSTLPMKSEGAERNVAFHEAHLCDVWYYEEERVPSQRCLRWMRTLDEIRYKKAMEEEEKMAMEEEEKMAMEEVKKVVLGEEENVARRAMQEESMQERGDLLRCSEKEQLALLSNNKASVSHSDAPNVLLVLLIGTALCVFLWLCSLKH